MVDALHEIHRVLAPRGVLVDARPDSRVLAYPEHVAGARLRRVGVVRTSRAELANDAASDRAIAMVVREGLFKRRRDGRFWHRVPFANLAEFVEYLSDHPRFEHRARWSINAAERRRIQEDPFRMKHAVRWELLDRRP